MTISNLEQLKNLGVDDYINGLDRNAISARKEQRDQFKADILTFIASNNTTAYELAEKLVSESVSNGQFFNNSFLLGYLHDLAVECGDFDVLKNEAVARAEVSKMAKFIIPKIQTELEKGYKLKDCGAFYKADKARFDELQEMFKAKFNNWFSLSRSYCGERFRVELSKNYSRSQMSRDGHTSQNTYKKSFDIFNDIERELITVDYRPTSCKQLKTAKNKVDKLEKQIRDLESELSKNKWILSY